MSPLPARQLGPAVDGALSRLRRPAMSAPVVEDVRYVGWMRVEGSWIESLSVCRGCKAQIAWTRTRRGALMPTDRDGTSHFATCPEAARFRRRP